MRQPTLVHSAVVKGYLPYATCEIGFLTTPERSAPWQQSPAMPVLEKTRPSEAGIRDYPVQKGDEPTVPVPDTLRNLGFLQVEVSVHCVRNNVHEL